MRTNASKKLATSLFVTVVFLLSNLFSCPIVLTAHFRYTLLSYFVARRACGNVFSLFKAPDSAARNLNMNNFAIVWVVNERTDIFP